LPGTNTVELKGQANTSNVVAVSVSIHDPAMYAATVFAEVLQRNGIEVTGSPQRDRTIRATLDAKGSPTTQPALNVLAIHETPIAAVLHRANKDSMNVYAEAMCKRLGAEVSGQSGSWENGTAAMAAFVKSCGVSDNEFSFDDGCGLSKQNGISANAIAHVLAHDFAGRNRDVFLESLSIAGVDGTLDNRFKDSDLRGRVMGKSGFINGVSALSGFVHAKDDRWYAFSVLMNGVGDVATCKQLQERIVKAIDAHAASASGITSAR
jgi:D-alanyl-D-alanine carboxypeptidase/D-alanyl-D-alanine-endopeptidase (penicillin-binding protein 4)